MIDFEKVWLPQIIQYARLISTGQLEDEWLGRATAKTSVTDADELHEQVFDDLDAESIWAGHRDSSGLTANAVEAIDRFLAALLAVAGSDSQPTITSRAWVSAKKAALDVVDSVR